MLRQKPDPGIRRQIKNQNYGFWIVFWSQYWIVALTDFLKMCGDGKPWWFKPSKIEQASVIACPVQQKQCMTQSMGQAGNMRCTLIASVAMHGPSDEACLCDFWRLNFPRPKALLGHTLAYNIVVVCKTYSLSVCLCMFVWHPWPQNL